MLYVNVSGKTDQAAAKRKKLLRPLLLTENMYYVDSSRVGVIADAEPTA